MTELTKGWCLGGTKLVMGGITLVGWLSGLGTQTGSFANRRYATFVGRLGEAAASGGGECGPCTDFASFTLAFALQLKKITDNLSQGN
jgi:hypothetical protein